MANDKREPFANLLTQGMVIKDGAKMSKSLGNVVDPDEIINKFGADTARLFILFASPPEKDLDWSERGVEGAHRFLSRVYRLVESNLDVLKHASVVRVPTNEITDENARSLKRITHSTLLRVTNDIRDERQFNTAVARLMELANALSSFTPKDDKDRRVMRESVEILLSCLCPFAPHMTEELWNLIGNDTFLSTERWFAVDNDALAQDSVTIVLQINGKIREQFTAKAGLSKEELEHDIMSREETKKRIEGKKVVKVVAVPGRLVNIVVKDA